MRGPFRLEPCVSVPQSGPELDARTARRSIGRRSWISNSLVFIYNKLPDYLNVTYRIAGCDPPRFGAPLGVECERSIESRARHRITVARAPSASRSCRRRANPSCRKIAAPPRDRPRACVLCAPARVANPDRPGTGNHLYPPVVERGPSRRARAGLGRHGGARTARRAAIELPCRLDARALQRDAIDRRPRAAVRARSRLFELAADIHRRSAGCFDPSVRPLVRLWGFDGDEPHVPGAERSPPRSSAWASTSSGSSTKSTSGRRVPTSRSTWRASARAIRSAASASLPRSSVCATTCSKSAASWRAAALAPTARAGAWESKTPIKWTLRSGR